MAITEDEIQSLRALDAAGNREDGWTFDELVAIADSLGPLLDEVERLRAENAKLESVAKEYSGMFDEQCGLRREADDKLAKARECLKVYARKEELEHPLYAYGERARQALKDTE